MEKRFSIEYKGNNFNCEIDKDGLVWIIDKDEMKSNNGQVRAAKNLDDAKEIAKLMLYSMGY
jgi:hypothetical protein